MPDINIRREHRLGFGEAKKRVEAIIASDGKELGLVGEFVEPRRFVFEASGANGAIIIGESDVTVLVDLSFLARPFKGEIEEEINRAMTAALSGAAPAPLDPEASPPPARVALPARGIQPVGPNLATAAKKKAPKPIGRRQKAAMVGGAMVGVTTMALVPGPLGRIISGLGAGYSAYKLICDVIGGCDE